MKYQKVRFSNQVFGLLLGVTFISIILVGAFWVQDNIHDYKEEIANLRTSYAESKRNETKYLILGLKDKIRWLRNYPIAPITKTIEKKLSFLRSFSDIPSGKGQKLVHDLQDSLSLLIFPTIILDHSGKEILRYVPEKSGTRSIVQSFSNARSNSDISHSGVFPVYRPDYFSDSLLSAFRYVNKSLFKNHTVVSLIPSVLFDTLLQDYVLDSISQLKFPVDEYVFINTYNGNALISNGRRNKEKVNIFQSGDANWIHVFKVEQTSALNQEGIFYSYSWNELSTNQLSPKTSYFSFFPEWKWIIGKGFHEDAIYSLIEAKKAILRDQLIKSLLKGLVILFVLVIISYLMAYYLAHRIRNNISLFNHFFLSAFNKNIKINRSRIDYIEFDELANSANQLLDEQEKTKTELKSSEERFSKIFNSSPDAILLTSLKDGLIVAANQSTVRISGYPSEELVGHHTLKLWHDEKERQKYVDQFRKANHVENYEIGIRTKTGEIINCLASGELIVYHGETFIINIVRDITEQKKVANRIRTLSKAVEQSPVPIIITDENGIIEYINSQFTSFMMYTMEDLKGRKPRIFNEGHMEQESFGKMWTTILSGNIWQGEFLNRKKDGSRYLENVIISPILDESEKITNFVLVLEDITEKKRILEDLVIAKEKAEESDKLKTAFLHNISHEIRTPMNAIIGFSGLLREERPDQQTIDHYTEIISASANHLLNIITDIVKIATIEAGQVKINWQKINLNNVFQVLQHNYQLKCQTSKLDFICKTPLPDESVNIFSDLVKLNEILHNLVDNAFKFTQKGRIETGYQVAGEFIEIYVKDTGIGIPEEMHALVFERFHQVENSLSRNYGGSGLGLSIAKAYVELMGGKIWLVSEERTGTTFHFTIPFKVDKATAVIKVPDYENSFLALEKDLHILIAEDDDPSFHLLRTLFVGIKNIKIIRAVNGKEAIKIAAEEKVADLVLMDINMPEMDGFEATRKIKAVRPDIPVIAQTAYFSEFEEDLIKTKGFDDLISKPINFNLLVDKIRRHLHL